MEKSLVKDKIVALQKLGKTVDQIKELFSFHSAKDKDGVERDFLTVEQKSFDITIKDIRAFSVRQHGVFDFILNKAKEEKLKDDIKVFVAETKASRESLKAKYPDMKFTADEYDIDILEAEIAEVKEPINVLR